MRTRCATSVGQFAPIDLQQVAPGQKVTGIKRGLLRATPSSDVIALPGSANSTASQHVQGAQVQVVIVGAITVSDPAGSHHRQLEQARNSAGDLALYAQDIAVPAVERLGPEHGAHCSFRSAVS